MILVDSSVWIDYLGVRSPLTGQRLEDLIQPNNQVVVTGIILQEVLQGIHNARSLALVRDLLMKLPMVIPSPSTHVRAAEIYRELGRKGTRLSTVDAFIAGLAIEHRLLLFTLDSDFEIISKNSSLKLFH